MTPPPPPTLDRFWAARSTMDGAHAKEATSEAAAAACAGADEAFDHLAAFDADAERATSEAAAAACAGANAAIDHLAAFDADVEEAASEAATEAIDQPAQRGLGEQLPELVPDTDEFL